MSEQQKGIKELSEMLDGLGEIALTGKKVMADGKIDLKDLPAAMELLNKSSVVIEGVKGADQIPAEVKDLSLEEAQAIVAKVLLLANKFKAA